MPGRTGNQRGNNAMQVTGNDPRAALRSAIAGGYVAEMSGQTYTVTAPSSWREL